jgi:hypothetical protein
MATKTPGKLYKTLQNSTKLYKKPSAEETCRVL